jgi:hypothetical protein
LLSLQKTVEDLNRRLAHNQPRPTGEPEDAMILPTIDGSGLPPTPRQRGSSPGPPTMHLQPEGETFSDGDSEGDSSDTAAYDLEAGDLISTEGLNHVRVQRLTELEVDRAGQVEDAVPGHQVAFDMRA